MIRYAPLCRHGSRHAAARCRAIDYVIVTLNNGDHNARQRYALPADVYACHFSLRVYFTLFYDAATPCRLH